MTWQSFVFKYPEDGAKIIVRSAKWGNVPKTMTFTAIDPKRNGGPSVSDGERVYWYPEKMMWKRAP